MEIPLYYEVSGGNFQLPNGYPGLVGRLNKIDAATILDAPNRDLIIHGILAAAQGEDEGIISRGMVAPVYNGIMWRVTFQVQAKLATDGETIDLPVADIPKKASISQVGVTHIVPMGAYGSSYSATFAFSKILEDGTEVTEDAPDPIAYDATDFAIDAPASSLVWTPSQMDLSDAAFLRLTITDPGDSSANIDNAPFFVEAILGTHLWE